MTARNGGQRIPPYVSYKSWEGLLDQLSEFNFVPTRLDESVWRRLRFSGSNRSALKNALVFLGLCSPDYRPTPQLEQIARASGEQRKSLLEGLVRQRYGPLLAGLDLSRATPGQLHEAFMRAGSKGETADKAVSFFTAFAQAAGVTLLDQVKTRKQAKRPPRTNRERRVSFAQMAEIGQKSQDKETDRTTRNHTSRNGVPVPSDPALHPAVAGVLGHLPQNGQRWTSHEKELFTRAFSAVLDLAYPVTDDTSRYSAESLDRLR